jgi:Serpin (serine protease inhibitor)
MSSTTVIYPIITALAKAEEIIGPERAWQAVNRTQALFLSEFFVPCRQESLSIAEIESIASFTADEINRFLRERGFRIQLAPFRRGGNWREIGVASVQDLLADWLRPGTETTVQRQDGKVYPAVRLGTAVSCFYRAAHHSYSVAQLETTSGDLVYMTRLDSAPADFELLSRVQQLSGSLQRIFDYNDIVFPMVELKQEVDSSWLLNLETTSSEGEPVKITQALQETHLAMNQEGARAKSAAALAMRVGAVFRPQPDLVIDRPFLVWFQRPRLTKPLFVGYITEEDWGMGVTL